MFSAQGKRTECSKKFVKDFLLRNLIFFLMDSFVMYGEFDAGWYLELDLQQK